MNELVQVDISEPCTQPIGVLGLQGFWDQRV